MVSPLQPLPQALRRVGISVVTVNDVRWGACHIKSIALLANVLARQQAVERGAADAILVRDGRLTEGTASNVFVVRDGILLTPPKDQFILPGITRDLVLELAAANNMAYHEQYLSREVLTKADEVWLTSSTKEILPVTSVDGRSVGNGVPGPLWRRMTNLYQAYKCEVCQPVTE
jgi:D-alanine transaminase